MIVSPFSKGISRPSSLKVGISFSLLAQTKEGLKKSARRRSAPRGWGPMPDLLRWGGGRAPAGRARRSAASRASTAPSMVTLASDHVQRAERGNHIGDHEAGDETAETLGDGEARRANADAVRRAAAVGDDVKTELAVAALGIAVG